MLIQIKERIPGVKNRDNFTGDGVLIGSHWRSAADGPFELDDRQAEKLITLGFASAVAQMPTQAAERAIEPTRNRERR